MQVGFADSPATERRQSERKMTEVTFQTQVEKVRHEIESSFFNIRQALAIRERVLLRQAEFLFGQSGGRRKERVEAGLFGTEGLEEILERISGFGHFNAAHLLHKDETFRAEDYVAPGIDHQQELKSLRSCLMARQESAHDFSGPPEPAQRQVQLQRPKTTVEQRRASVAVGPDGEGVRHVPIMVERATEAASVAPIIDSTTETKYIRPPPVVPAAPPPPPLVDGKSKANKQVLIAATSSGTQTEPRFHFHRQQQTSPVRAVRNVSQLTLSNSAGGAIHMRNITNLTINMEGRLRLDGNGNGNGNGSGAASPPTNVETRIDSPECGFYERLIAENKHIRHYQLLRRASPPHTSIDTVCSDVEVHAGRGPGPATRVEVNTTVLTGDAAAAADAHAHIWLKQIISETEAEPLTAPEVSEIRERVVKINRAV